MDYYDSFDYIFDMAVEKMD